MNDDITLLREFAVSRSERAFETLVSRHVNLVHSAALRQLNDWHQAGEVAQVVFIILARKAESLGDKTVLSGWLYRTTRFVAMRALKSEMSRQRREQDAHMQTFIQNSETDEAWKQLTPILDEAMARLGGKERDALVLRYFENKSLKEVGAALEIEERAAQKRVARGLEKLRGILAKRGIALTTVIIAGAISANSVQAAPAMLAKTISAVAVAKSAAAGGSTLTFIKGALKVMAWSKAQTAIVIGGGILLAAGTTTLTAKKIETYYAYRDSWRVTNLNSDIVDKTPPQVRILSTKFHHGENQLAENNSNTKWGGINTPVSVIAWVAYNWRPARVVFDTPPPWGRYDFIATLPQGSYEALQRELKTRLGFVGRRETREVGALVLKVRNPNASGLKPPVTGGGNDWSGQGYYVCDDRALSSDQPPFEGLTRFLEQYFDMPIIDQTGLTQHFSIDLKWDERGRRDPDHAALKQAILDQLGLELVPSHEPVEMLVMEKTAN